MAIKFADSFDLYADSTALAQRYVVASSVSLMTGRFGVGQALQIRANNGFSMHRAITATDALAVGFSFVAVGTGLSGAGTNRSIMQFRNNTTVILDLTYDATGVMRVRRGTTDIAESAPIITNGVWNHIEVIAVRHASAGSVDVKLNGVSIITATGVNTGASAIDNFRVLSGNGTNDASNYIAYDDLVYANAAVSLGPMRINVLRPSADTAQKDWTPSTGTDNYAMVDDATYDGDSTYVSASTPGALDLYDFGNLSYTPDSIVALQVLYAARKDDVTLRTIRPNVKSGADTAVGATIGPGEVGYTIFSDIISEDPATSAPWTPTAVNAIQAGIEVVA
jgi:hypothetical protein